MRRTYEYPDFRETLPPFYRSKINLCRHLWASDLQKCEISTSPSQNYTCKYVEISLVNKSANVNKNILLIGQIVSISFIVQIREYVWESITIFENIFLVEIKQNN